MKKIFTIFSAILLGAGTLVAQNFRGTVTFEGTQLVEVGDSLALSVNIDVHAGAVVSYEGMRLTPVLTDGVNSLEFPYVEILGRHRHNMKERWEALRSKKLSYKEAAMCVEVDSKDTLDTRLDYEMKAPYRLWMDDARLVFHQEIIGYRGEFRLFTFSMDGRVKLEPCVPYKPTYEVAFVTPEREDKRRTKQGQAFLDFPVNQSAILPAYRRNPEELAKIADAFVDVQDNSDVRIMGLYVEGFASPEGGYSINDRLARERSFALKRYMQKQFGIPSNMFKVDYTAEDWDGLKAMVLGSELAGKDEIASIIDTEPDPDRREVRIKALGGGHSWRVIVSDMLPQLRRVEYQIDYSVKDFTADEAVAMIGTKDEMLSQLEFYSAAQSVGKGSPLYEDIMIERIPRYFPDDATALNNAAGVLIERGETATALRYLERAGESPAVWNNIGVAYLVSGRLDQAEAQFRKAAAAGVAEAKHNLEQVALKRADNIKMARYQNR